MEDRVYGTCDVTKQSRVILVHFNTEGLSGGGPDFSFIATGLVRTRKFLGLLCFTHTGHVKFMLRTTSVIVGEIRKKDAIRKN